LILRALGYTDTGDNPDFYYRDAIGAALSLGVLYPNEAKILKAEPFRRDHLVFMSYVGLLSYMKDSNATLLNYLIENEVVGARIAYLSINWVNLKRR